MSVFTEILLGAGIFLAALFILPSLWLTFWMTIQFEMEMAWNRRITLFSGGAFLIGLAFGAFGYFVLVAHRSVSIFGPWNAVATLVAASILGAALFLVAIFGFPWLLVKCGACRKTGQAGIQKKK